MSWWGGVRVRFRGWFLRAKVEREVAEEMDWHVEMEAQKYARQGMATEEARRKALIAFGGVERYRDAHRDVRGLRQVERVWYDLRYAVAALIRSPTFTASAVLTLAIGIGANTAAFGMLNALLHRAPAGVGDADRLFRVRLLMPDASEPASEARPYQTSYPVYRELQKSFAGLAELSAYWSRPVIEGHGPDAQERRAVSATTNYFATLRVQPALGRFWSPQEDALADAEVVLAHGFWKRRFGGDPAVLGQSIVLSEVPVRIIGVAPADFRGIDLDPVDVWLPLSFETRVSVIDDLADPDVTWLWTLGRLGPGATPVDVETRGTQVLRTVPEELDTWGARTSKIGLAPLADPFRGYGRTRPIPNWTLAVTAVVLLIACANVSGLLLARGAGRRRELAVRVALGASRGRIVQLLLIESSVIALLGGAAGVGLAVLVAKTHELIGVPPLERFADVRVLSFSLGVALLASLTVGLVPALRFARAEVQRDLGGRGIFDRLRLRSALTVLQISMSIVLLLNAVLFVRSLRNVRPGDAGFEPERIAVVSLWFQRGTPQERVREVKRESIDRLRALPGVTLASLATAVPFAPDIGIARFDGASLGIPALPEFSAVMLDVERDYFATLALPLLQGRLMDETDREGAEPVAVVSLAMAKLFGGDRAALGRCMPARGGCARIVGVVGDFRFPNPSEEPMPVLYRSMNQYAGAPGRGRLLLQTEGPTDLVAATIRAELGAVAPEVLFLDVQSMSDLLRTRLQPWRVATIIFGFAGGVAFLLAAIGLYGVISYMVLSRTHEIGVRVALGARPLGILGLIVREGAQLIVIGSVLGVFVAPWISGMLEQRMYGVSATDPTTYALTIAFVVTMALVTTLAAAGRAARIAPDLVVRAD